MHGRVSTNSTDACSFDSCNSHCILTQPCPFLSDWCNLLGCAGCTDCRRRQLQEQRSAKASKETDSSSRRSLRGASPQRRLSAWYNSADGTWSWMDRTLNTWTNYTVEETKFDQLASSTLQTEPPVDYLSAIHAIDQILLSIAAEMNTNLTSTEPRCFLGAKLKGN